jgi:cell wall-associated NlpC family hydrolase
MTPTTHRGTHLRRTRTARVLTTAAAVAVGLGLVAPIAAPSAAAAPLVAPTQNVTSGPRLTAIGDDPIANLAASALGALQHLDSGAGTPAAGSAAAAGDYLDKRNDVAAAVAERLEIDAVALQQAWAKADLEHQEALLAALTQLGTPYRRNSSNPGVGFDCSGLTTFAWGVVGHTLTRQSGSQINEAEPRTMETAQAGDLAQYPGHVMMWLGVDRAMVHSPYSGKDVEVFVMSSKRTLKFGDPTVPA